MGYEVMGRISRALGRESNKQHHATGQAGTFGATAAAAKTMGLDVGPLTNALGLAGCMASGLMEFAEDPRGTMVKHLYGGWPSQSGVVAAWLADPHCYDDGVVSDPAILATARKIYARLDAEVDAFPRYAARITAQLNDGRRLTVEAWDHKGTAAKPFSTDDVVAKFEKVTASVMPLAAARRLSGAVTVLDTNALGAMSALCAALRAAHS